MTKRKYTTEEISRMRSALCYIVRESDPNLKGVSYDAMAEMQLRTYILNGTEPEELEEEQRGWEITNSGDDDDDDKSEYRWP